MKLHHNFLLLIVSFLLFSSSQISEYKSGYSIAKLMFMNAPKINSLIYTITKEERIDGEMIKQISFTKMEKDPYKVYLKQLYPKKGMEILYVEGKNNNKALINPNGFPWVNIKLNPHESLMRNDQHHTIFQSGFDHVISILEFSCNKYISTIEEMVLYNGNVSWDGKECYSITFENPSFEYVDYTVMEDENVTDIASRLKLSEYMILEKNKSVSDYDDVKEGQVITIPTCYSPKMLLLIDVENLVPVSMTVFDELGVYEKYEYTEVSINPTIPAEEFSQNYSKYSF